jgi:peptidoglycan-associated lipoprotein
MNLKKIAIVGLLIVGASLTGCGKKKDLKSDEAIEGGGDVTQSEVDGGRADSDSENAMGMKTIFFPYDSFEITGEQKETLNNNARILKDNPTVAVQIEGHCDDRGGIQYNLALGEKRAAAIQSQLAAAGIAKSRITTISMGKEKPLVNGSGEEAWAKNRRGNFVITSK